MIRLVFPWPPKQLMPNFKRSHHWTAYRRQVKAARTLGWGLTVQARQSTRGPAFPYQQDIYSVTIEATPPMRPGPTPDEDNFKGALKHYLDGIADGLSVNDRQFTFEAMVWKPREGAGKVVITIA